MTKIDLSKTQVHIEKMYDDVIMPEYITPLDAGMDIYAYETVGLMPGQTELIHTGIKVAIPQGFEIQIRPRSGLSLKTLFRIANAPGTIDAGYRGEVCVIGFHAGDSTSDPIIISKGDRIAQMVLQRVERIKWAEVNNIDDIPGNRGGGFGSTGD